MSVFVQNQESSTIPATVAGKYTRGNSVQRQLPVFFASGELRGRTAIFLPLKTSDQSHASMIIVSPINTFSEN